MVQSPLLDPVAHRQQYAARSYSTLPPLSSPHSMATVPNPISASLVTSCFLGRSWSDDVPSAGLTATAIDSCRRRYCITWYRDAGGKSEGTGYGAAEFSAIASSIQKKMQCRQKAQRNHARPARGPGHHKSRPDDAPICDHNNQPSFRRYGRTG